MLRVVDIFIFDHVKVFALHQFRENWHLSFHFEICAKIFWNLRTFLIVIFTLYYLASNYSCTKITAALWGKMKKKGTFTLKNGLFRFTLFGWFFLVEDIKVDRNAKFQVIWCWFRDSRAVWSWKLVKILVFSYHVWTGKYLNWFKILQNGFQFLLVVYKSFILTYNKV